MYITFTCPSVYRGGFQTKPFTLKCCRLCLKMRAPRGRLQHWDDILVIPFFGAWVWAITRFTPELLRQWSLGNRWTFLNLRLDLLKPPLAGGCCDDVQSWKWPVFISHFRSKGSQVVARLFALASLLLNRNSNLFMSINWRASLVPAAAVIPAPIAYVKVVAVKKARSWISVEDDRLSLDIFLKNVSALDCVVRNLIDWSSRMTYAG